MELARKRFRWREAGLAEQEEARLVVEAVVLRRALQAQAKREGRAEAEALRRAEEGALRRAEEGASQPGGPEAQPQVEEGVLQPVGQKSTE